MYKPSSRIIRKLGGIWYALILFPILSLAQTASDFHMNVAVGHFVTTGSDSLWKGAIAVVGSSAYNIDSIAVGDILFDENGNKFSILSDSTLVAGYSNYINVRNLDGLARPLSGRGALMRPTSNMALNLMPQNGNNYISENTESKLLVDNFLRIDSISGEVGLSDIYFLGDSMYVVFLNGDTLSIYNSGPGYYTPDTSTIRIYAPSHGWNADTVASYGYIPTKGDWTRADASSVENVHIAYIVNVPHVDSLDLKFSGIVTYLSWHGKELLDQYYLTDSGYESTTPGTITVPTATATDSLTIVLSEVGALYLGGYWRRPIPSPFITAYGGDPQVPTDAVVQAVIEGIFEPAGLALPGTIFYTAYPGASRNPTYQSSTPYTSPLTPSNAWMWDGNLATRVKELLVSIDLEDDFYGVFGTLPLAPVGTFTSTFPPSDSIVAVWLEANYALGLRLPSGSVAYYIGTGSAQRPEASWTIIDDLSNISADTDWEKLIKKTNTHGGIFDAANEGASVAISNMGLDNSNLTVDGIYQWQFTGDSGLPKLYILNSTGGGLYIRDGGMTVIDTSSLAATISSINGSAMRVSAAGAGSYIAQLEHNPIDSSSVLSAINMVRYSTGTPQVGMGNKIVSSIELNTGGGAFAFGEIAFTAKDNTSTGRTGNYAVNLYDSTTVKQALFLEGDKRQMTLSGYGASALLNTDSAMYIMGSDYTGDIWTTTPASILASAGGGGIFSAANNGKTTAISAMTLGSNLAVTGGTYGSTFTRNSASAVITGNNSGAGAGLYGISSSGYGVQGSGPTGVYGVGNSGGLGGLFSSSSSGTNDYFNVLRVERATSGTPASGLGGGIDFRLQSTSTITTANEIVSRWSDATHASRTSILEIYGYNNAVSGRKMAIAGNGLFTWDGYAANAKSNPDSALYFAASDYTGDIWTTTAAAIVSAGGAPTGSGVTSEFTRWTGTNTLGSTTGITYSSMTNNTINYGFTSNWVNITHGHNIGSDAGLRIRSSKHVEIVSTGTGTSFPSVGQYGIVQNTGGPFFVNIEGLAIANQGVVINAEASNTYTTGDRAEIRAWISGDLSSYQYAGDLVIVGADKSYGTTANNAGDVILVGGAGSGTAPTDGDVLLAWTQTAKRGNVGIGKKDPAYTLDITTGGFRITGQSAAPTGLGGVMYFDTDDNTMWIHDGTNYDAVVKGDAGSWTSGYIPYSNGTQLTSRSGLRSHTDTDGGISVGNTTPSSNIAITVRTNSAGQAFLAYNDSGSEIFRVANNGSIRFNSITNSEAITLGTANIHKSTTAYQQGVVWQMSSSGGNKAVSYRIDSGTPFMAVGGNQLGNDVTDVGLFVLSTIAGARNGNTLTVRGSDSDYTGTGNGGAIVFRGGQGQSTNNTTGAVYLRTGSMLASGGASNVAGIVSPIYIQVSQDTSLIGAASQSYETLMTFRPGDASVSGGYTNENTIEIYQLRENPVTPTRILNMHNDTLKYSTPADIVSAGGGGYWIADGTDSLYSARDFVGIGGHDFGIVPGNDTPILLAQGTGTSSAGRTTVSIWNRDALDAGAARLHVVNSEGGSISVQASSSGYSIGAQANMGSSGGIPVYFSTDGDIGSGGTQPMHFRAGGYLDSEIDLTINADGLIVFNPISGSTPTGEEGGIFMDGDDNQMYLHDGTDYDQIITDDDITNGLSFDGTADAFKLGGALTENTTLTGAYTLDLSGDVATDTKFQVTNNAASGVAIRGISSASTGVIGSSTSGGGGYFSSGTSNGATLVSTSGYGGLLQSTSNIAALLTNEDGTTNTVGQLMQLQHTTSTTPLAGFGTEFAIRLEADATIVRDAVEVGALWTNPDDDWESAEFFVDLALQGAMSKVMSIDSADAFIGNYILNVWQTVGAGTDNYVLTYDNGTGLIGLEAATGGGNVSNTGTPVDDQIAVWTAATTIEGTSSLTFTATQFTAGSYVFNRDQTVGVSEDNYVLTYDNASGEISLEAAVGGGNVSNSGTPVDNQLAVWTGATTVEGDPNLIWDANTLVFGTGKAIGTSTSAGNTLLLQAYDVDGVAYTTFATLTANNTPTMDLAAAVTINSNAIAYAGGTFHDGFSDYVANEHRDATTDDWAGTFDSQEGTYYVDIVNDGTPQLGAALDAQSNDITGLNNIVVDAAGAIQTATGAGNTLVFQAYDVDGVAYTTFATLTANNTPTMDLSTSVTYGGTTIATTADLHNAVTLNASATTGGLSLATQEISFQAATTSLNGYLTSTDWNTFNNKLSAEVDGSVSNEGALTLTDGAGTVTMASNTSGSTDVTYAASGIATVNSTGNTLTVGATEVDGSISNEGSLTVGAGAANTSLISSNTSGSTDVTLEASTTGFLTISEASNTITLQADPLFIKSITIESPTSSENIGMFFTDVAITIDQINHVVVGTTPSVTWNIDHATTRNSGAPNSVFSPDVTTTSESGAETTSFNDATIPAGSWVWFTSSAQSGTVTEITVTLSYTID